jgi:hypothetical protein
MDRRVYILSTERFDLSRKKERLVSFHLKMMAILSFDLIGMPKRGMGKMRQFSDMQKNVVIWERLWSMQKGIEKGGKLSDALVEKRQTNSSLISHLFPLSPHFLIFSDMKNEHWERIRQGRN